jgi:hypothetical protein
MTIWQFMGTHPILTVILALILVGFIERIVRTIVTRNAPKCNCDEED